MRQQLSNFITGARAEDPDLGAATGGGAAGRRGWRYTPQPAWWVAVLWKRLVGTKALGTTATGSDVDTVHAFGFDRRGTGQPHRGGPGAGDSTGIVLVLVNWDEQTDRLTAVEVAGCRHKAQIYELTPAGRIHDGDDDGSTVLPDSEGIAVNGVEARVGANGTIPAGVLAPRSAKCFSGKARLKLAGLSAAFVVLE